MRTLPNRLCVAAAAIVVAAPAWAQAPVERPATHTVKRGDTLWELAKTYLGDAMQWPQIFRANSDKIRDPHWIYPGQVLKLPGGTAAAPAGGGQEAAPARRGGMTVFNPAMYQTGHNSRESLLLNARRTAVRPGDYESAPFLWSEGGPPDGGRVDGTTEPSGFQMSRELRPIQQMEDAFLTLPRGVEAAAGTKVLAYRLDDVITGGGQVLVPTGVFRVTRLLSDGRAEATLVKKFEDVFAGQRVTTYDSLAMPAGVRPTRVEFGLSTRLAWLYAHPILSGVGREVIFAATSNDGLVPGDQVTLRRPRPAGVGEGLADEDVAVAQITRVTPWGASGILLDATDAGIVVGMRAQVTAKMP